VKVKVSLSVILFLLVLVQPILQAQKVSAVSVTTTKDGFWDETGFLTGLDAGDGYNYVGYSANFGKQRSAVQFDLYNINQQIESATLTINIASINSLPTTNSNFANVYGINGDPWGNTAPTNVSDLLDSSKSLRPGDISFDVTSFVVNQLSGDKKVAFLLVGNEMERGVEFAFYSSYANEVNKPKLEIVYAAPKAKAPTVTSAVTLEDTQTTSGLVLSPNASDSAVSHFKITNITGGTLYKNDGTTMIHNNDFITLTEGAAGLKFMPNPDANTPAGDSFTFTAQAALDANATGLSDPTQAVITVAEVNDRPVVVNDTLADYPEDNGELIVPFNALLANDSVGPANESSQTLTIHSVEKGAGGNVRIEGTNVIFTPEANYYGTANFKYTVEDNGTTNNAPDPLTSVPGNVSFAINPIAEVPEVTPATTAEDTKSTTGLVITPNIHDGASVTHFRITEITGGQLYKYNGVTSIMNGDFITVAEGAAGLKFMPNPDANSGSSGPFTFNVQATLDAAGTGISETKQANITVTEVNDAPYATNDSLIAIQEDSGARMISFAELLANDSAGPGNESSQTLTITSVGIATGGTVEIEGTNIVFTPALHHFGTASFQYTIEDNGTTSGMADPKASQATASLAITPVADTPVITNAITLEDTQSSNGLVLTRNPADGLEVTHFKITGITGGALYKNDGTTRIMNGDFMTVAEGEAGLKFTPAADTHSPTGTFTFNAQAGIDSSNVGLSEMAQAVITVSEVNDTPLANDDTLPHVQEDGSPIILPITQFLSNDTTGDANEGTQMLTIKSIENPVGVNVEIEGENLIISPLENYHGMAGFQYTIEDNGTTNGSPDPKTDQAMVSFTITPVADAPIVTNATTAEDAQSSNNLVITRNPVDGLEVTFYKITGITGGQLFYNDGTTPINEGEFISTISGAAGLKFTPSANANSSNGGVFSFVIQAGITEMGDQVGQPTKATITVTEVNDAPIAGNDSLTSILEDSEDRIISFASLLGNDAAGAENENSQTLNIKSVGNPVGGTVRIEGTNVIFTPAANYHGQAGFSYTVEDNGTTDGSADPKTNQASVSFNIDPLADTPSITNTVTAEDTQSTNGLVLTRNAVDGAEVTHLKMTGITGGQLYKNDGKTVINNGDFITAAEAGAGLKFTPSPNANTEAGDLFTFNVQAALDAIGTGLSDSAQATITVTEANDAPFAANDILSAMHEDSAPKIVEFSELLGNDTTGTENESSQSLTIKSVDNPSGGTVAIQDGQIIFTLAANYHGQASFSYTVEDNGTTDGMADPKTAQASVSFNIDPLADIPLVTNAVTAEDTQSTNGLVLTRNGVDGAEVTHLKMTGITGGQLYKNDGTTVINNGEFITAGEGAAGLKFTPSPNANTGAGDQFTFNVQAALDANGTGLSDSAQATITVTEVNDAPIAANDTLSAVLEDSASRTISITSLLANDTAGPSNENGQNLTLITVENPIGGTVRMEGDNIIFTPAANFYGPASFLYTVEDSGNTDGNADKKSAQATVFFTIEPAADTPSVTTTAIAEDTQSTTGLVITKNTEDGAEVTHFKITEILGGKLYKNDGATQILDGDIMTTAEGAAGLKFTPAENTNTLAGDAFSFTVQAALDGNETSISSPTLAVIHVTEVNDHPITTDDQLTNVYADYGYRSISFATLLRNDHVGPSNENNQGLTVKSVSDAIGGTAEIVGTNIIFKIDPSYQGPASFKYTAEDNGTTNGQADPKTAQGTVTFTIEPVPAVPTPQPSKQEINVDIETGTAGEGKVVYRTPITRTTEPNGRVYDEVNLTQERAKEAVGIIKQSGQDTARFIIPDTKDEVSRIDFTLQKEAVQEFVKGTTQFEIFTENVQFQVPYQSMTGWNEDIYFRLIPIKDEKERAEVEARAKKEELVKNRSAEMTILGRPMTIETNLQNRPVTLVLPLGDIKLPEEENERAAFLAELTIFVEHSDGSKEILQGKLVEVKNGKYGLQFEVNKFSTFTILKLTIEEEEPANIQKHSAYVFGFQDQTFRPESTITRAQMASLLARINANKKDVAANPKVYSDIPANHWAKEDIQFVTQTKLMNGYGDGSFKPSKNMTRAEMAVTISRWLGVEGKSQATSVDTKGHWAEKEISLVQQAGYMKGQTNGQFKPNANLTRAEAVVILNRILKRGPLHGDSSIWKDVPVSHWAYKDIAEASTNHLFIMDGSGKEQKVK
jgi:hypothetical protein